LEDMNMGTVRVSGDLVVGEEVIGDTFLFFPP